MKIDNYILSIACTVFVSVFSNAQMYSQEIHRIMNVQGVLTDAFESKPLQGKHSIKTGVYVSTLAGFSLYE